MSEGYLFCFTTPSRPGIVMVGMTFKTPEAELNEANNNDPLCNPYEIAFAKKVSNASEKEKTLHILLEKYHERIPLHHKLFRASPEEVRNFFNFTDGDMWVKEVPQKKQATVAPEKQSTAKGYREEMRKYFTNNVQRIRHTTTGSNPHTLYGIYDSHRNVIVCDSEDFGSPSGFASHNYKCFRPDRVERNNGWEECEYEVDGKWICIDSLRH